jgi:hypothetical protein
LEFEAGLCGASALNERPAFSCRGGDDMVKKAYKTICFLRHCADRVTIFETDIVPYLLALLEWTYPVVSYGNASFLQKKFSAYSAGPMVSKLLERECL